MMKYMRKLCYNQYNVSMTPIVYAKGFDTERDPILNTDLRMGFRRSGFLVERNTV